MSYPFPGMNPWLEDVQLWRGVHLRLINALGDALAPVLEPRYFVDVETHTYVARFPDDPPMTRYPDITVLDMGGRVTAVAPTVKTAMPIEIELPYREGFEEPYLQIRLAPAGEVVTVIELLSHTNKRQGRDRNSYMDKRQLFLDADVNFVEIDLLRAGWPTYQAEETPVTDYRIFIRRKEPRKKAFLYLFNVPDSIPVFPLPLLPDDQEPPVDLGALLRGVYERARYRLVIDYSRPLALPLSEADAAWAAQCVADVANR